MEMGHPVDREMEIDVVVGPTGVDMAGGQGVAPSLFDDDPDSAAVLVDVDDHDPSRRLKAVRRPEQDIVDPLIQVG